MEYQRTNFHANVNAYHARSDKKTIADEQVLAGYDIRLTGQAPYLPWATIKGTHYFWDSKAGDNIKGTVLGIEVELTPSISFEFGQQDDTTTSPKSYGKLNVKLPFDDHEQLTHFVIADTPFKASSKMDLGALAWVERDNKIRVDGVDGNGCSSMVAGGITYRVVNIGTQCWTAENMRHAATTGNTWNYDDTIANLPYNDDGYGLLYDWAAAMAGSTAEGAQGICATGWHIPSQDDWTILKGALGTNPSTQLQVGGSSGFEGLLAGWFYLYPPYFNDFIDRDTRGHFWGSTQNGGGAWSLSDSCLSSKYIYKCEY